MSANSADAGSPAPVTARGKRQSKNPATGSPRMPVVLPVERSARLGLEPLRRWHLASKARHVARVRPTWGGASFANATLIHSELTARDDGEFYESRDLLLDAFARFAGNPVSASGNGLLMVGVAVALISLGWRRGWLLFAPGLLAQQPHYIVFSLEAAKWSRILALAMTIPIQHAMAAGILVYALHARLTRD